MESFAQFLTSLKEWIPSVAAVSLIVGFFMARRDYKLKLQAEARAAESQRAETDVRLLTALTDLLHRASGRGGYEVSDRVIEELFKRNVFTDADFRDWSHFQKKLGEFPLVYIPVGSVEQTSAITAIFALGQRHDFLRPVVIRTLESIYEFNPSLIKNYLEQMKSFKSN